MSLKIFLKSQLPRKEITVPLGGFYLELLNGNNNIFTRGNAFLSYLCEDLQFQQWQKVASAGANFYKQSTQTLLHCRQTCLANGDGYVEK